MDKTYLGDAIYIESENGGQVILTTSDGETDTNTIYLEPDVIAKMQHWLNIRGFLHLP